MNLSEVDISDVKSTEIGSSALHRDQTQQTFKRFRIIREATETAKHHHLYKHEQGYKQPFLKHTSLAH